MILRHVLVGAFFTVAGLVSLLIPAVPFICIGALIFGPIELLVGLFGGARQPMARRSPVDWTAPPIRAPISAPVGAPVGVKTAKFCPSCGMQNERMMNFCTGCGARLSDPTIFGTKG